MEAGTLEEVSGVPPTSLRVTNLMRMSDHVRYDRRLGGYVVLEVPA